MKKQFSTLYKTNSNGKIQQWTIVAKTKADGTAEYSTEYGLLNGKTQITTVKIKHGKNINRANATTPYQQAVSEAQAKWIKQKDRGYSEHLISSNCKRPMLAHDYNKYKHKVVFPAYIQPKLDGIRCIAYLQNKSVVLLSRGNKQLNVPHIKSSLFPLLNKHPNLVLDGELYNHRIPFQKIVSLVKRIQENTHKIQYHVYDCIADKGFTHRIATINNVLSPSEIVIPVITEIIHDFDDVVLWHNIFKRKGYEGAIVRSGECNYKEGYRSQELLKVKTFKEAEFEIIGAKEGIGKCEGQCIFLCKTSKGAEFEVRCMGTDELRQEQWIKRNSYIGKMLTVKFFDWTTSENSVPKWPVGIVVRDYE